MLYGIAIAVPLLLVLGALIVRTALVERDQLELRTLQVLGDLVNNLERDFDRHVTVLNTIATDHSLKNRDWPAFYDQAKAALQGRAYLVLVDATGRQIVNTYVAYGEQPAMTGDPETIRRMMQSKGPIVSNLFSSLVVKKPVYNVSIPIQQDDEVRFILSLGLLPHDLEALLLSQNLASDWVTHIWDANGVIIARSRDSARYLGTTLPEHLRAPSPGGIVRTTNLDGIDVLHASAKSQISGWGVGVNVPYALVSQQLQRSLVLWAAAAISATILALGLGVLFARQITRPLSLATSAAAALGSGRALAQEGSRLREADIFIHTLEAAQRELAERTAALERAEEQFRLAVEAAPTGMILTDSDGRIVLVNGQVEKMLGYDRRELVGQKIELLVPNALRESHPADRASFVANPSMRLMGTGRDVFAERKDGSVMPVEIGLSPIVTPHGTMVLSAIVDITDRLKALESQHLVIRELNHRTRNILAVVQTLTDRSIDEAKTFAEAKFVVKGRLRALAQAYAMLAEAKWEGASLRAIIDGQIAELFDRIKITGCDIVLAPGAAQQFAMITHELMTNALKYGALSTDAGRVAIEGTIDRGDGLFSFVWSERGGPPVSPPDKKGFGSVILFDAAEHFAEDVKVEFSRTGLIYGLQLKLIAIEQRQGVTSTPAGEETA
jgi:PAS domain S-box-containing protein